mmetsp:Transcript_50024/g.115454  ORF Transcript_50024/g.115454 Transcript_50024/m.115454 type:complete len:229 (+) Transcript_50024:401-1087(+)
MPSPFDQKVERCGQQRAYRDVERVCDGEADGNQKVEEDVDDASAEECSPQGGRVGGHLAEGLWRQDAQGGSAHRERPTPNGRQNQQHAPRRGISKHALEQHLVCRSAQRSADRLHAAEKQSAMRRAPALTVWCPRSRENGDATARQSNRQCGEACERPVQHRHGKDCDNRRRHTEEGEHERRADRWNCLNIKAVCARPKQIEGDHGAQEENRPIQPRLSGWRAHHLEG